MNVSMDQREIAEHILNTSDFAEVRVTTTVTRLLVIVRHWGVVIIDETGSHVNEGHHIYIGRDDKLVLLMNDGRYKTWQFVTDVVVTAN